MFLLGIGVDDMFLLLSGLAETYDCKGPLEPEDRIKMTMRTSGVGITITSLTDLLAFLIGATSSFMSVRNFCVYTGLYLRLFFTEIDLASLIAKTKFGELQYRPKWIRKIL